MKVMKPILILLFAIAVSCTPDDTTPTAVVVDDTFDPATATLLKSGPLMGVGHTVSGAASVYQVNGKKIVLLDPYSSQNGPDLRVYLSKDKDANSYINLGKLKSINGKQSYDVPGNLDLTDYAYVIIWCQQFTVLFGRAEVK